MALILSKHGNVAFRTEEVAVCFHKLDKDNNITKEIHIILKSGGSFKIVCRTIEEANNTFNNIINVMTNDYDTK